MGSTGKCCYRGWWQLVLIKKGLSQLYIETSVKNHLADAKRGGGGMEDWRVETQPPTLGRVLKNKGWLVFKGYLNILGLL
jgi:hypothetical protein